MKEKISAWFLYTKIGRFLFVFGLSVILDGLFLFVSTDWFYKAVLGSLFVSLFYLVTEENKKWY